ncbi:hypothetical protein HY009_06050 [Candidatus Acetothermia bacterium]|nr:hypothetical protein [Candidatus Acetothermia bacterium]
MLINFLAVGLSTNNGSQGEVQFINTTPNQLAACTGATTPASLVTMGPISTLAKALEIDSGVRQQLPKAQDQPVFVFATARDGRVYPYRVAPINEDPTKLAARFAPNDESKDTPFVPVQPIQAFPFVETAVSSANSPAVFIYYVSDAVYCRRYSPLLDTVQGQLTLCSETAPSANTLFLR